MKTIIIATKNKGKIKEFENMFKRFDYQVKSLFDIIDIDIEETGTTFEENAILKAETISKMLNEIVISDDSGLEVLALDNRPGVYSARYASDHNDLSNNKKVLSELVGIEDRRARFVCCIALAIPNKETIVVRGECNGEIIDTPRGENGFGYDPIFFLADYNKTMAELPMEEKNKISHRSNAMKKLLEILVDKNENINL